MRQFPTTPQDWFNYIAQGAASNALIQYVIKLGQLIDYEILKKAVYRSITIEPILGSKFVIEESHPKWVSIKFKIKDICCLRKTQSVDQETHSVLAQELNASTNIPILVYLITDHISNVIVIKINHAVCDGAGSKYYIKLLAESYTKIIEGDLIDSPNNSTDRCTAELYNTLGIRKIEEYFDPKKIDLQSTWGFPIIREKDCKQIFSYQLKSFEPLKFFKIKDYANKYNTTINTVLIAAYHFALIQVLQPSFRQMKEVQFTSDLRKYLPQNKNQTICNLSAILNVNLSANNQNFEKIVTDAATALKKGNTLESIIQGTIANDLCVQSGFSACIDMFTSEWENILKTGRCTPMISNLGVLIPDDIQFGDIHINEVYFISPAFFTPAFMLGVSTYKNKLTFCASYYAPEMPSDIIEKLLKEIEYFIKRLTQVA